MLEFSEVYKQTGSVCSFSPNGYYLATVVDFRVVIRDAETLQITHLFTTTDKVDKILWSPDSELLLCASYRSSVIQVWSLNETKRTGQFDDLGNSINDFSARPGVFGNRFLERVKAKDQEQETKDRWTCTIDEGLAGLTNVMFAPDGRHVLSFSDFSLRVTVWSLISGDAFTIEYPKSPKTVAWRRDGRYLALATRRDTTDCVSVYDAETWSLAKNFAVGTVDLQMLQWSPDGRFLALADSSLQRNLLVYYPNGRLVAEYTLPPSKNCSLGFKSICWSPGSQLLAVGSYDGVARILNYYTWQPVVEWDHPAKLNDLSIAHFTLTEATSSILNPSERYAVAAASEITIQSVQPNQITANPKLGVGLIQFDCSGRILLSRNDSMPNYLWFWDVFTLSQISLVQNSHPISAVAWNPTKPGLLAFISQPTLSGKLRSMRGPANNSFTTGRRHPKASKADEVDDNAPEKLVSWVYLWRGKTQTANLVNPTEELERFDAIERQPMSRAKSASPTHQLPLKDALSVKPVPTEVVSTCEAIPIPAVHFLVHKIEWSPNGESILLYDREKFCLSFCI